MNSQIHLLKRCSARVLRIHPFSSTPLPNSVSDIDSHLVSLCQSLTPRNANHAFSLFHSAIASNSLPSGFTCNALMAALTRTRNYPMALSVYGGCAHGATKEWWTNGSECGSMFHCYGVDSVDL